MLLSKTEVQPMGKIQLSAATQAIFKETKGKAYAYNKKQREEP